MVNPITMYIYSDSFCIQSILIIFKIYCIHKYYSLKKSLFFLNLFIAFIYQNFKMMN